MAKLVDLVGKTFGKWTVVKRVRPDGKRGHSFWWCVCSCGNETHVNAADLKSGRSQGCVQCRYVTQRGAKHPINPVFSHTKGNAQARGLKFSIDRDYAYSIFESQGGCCALTGLPLKIHRSPGERYSSCTASLDRIDSSQGYIPGNVQWVYKPINNMKWKLTEEEFVHLCRLIVQEADRKLGIV